MTPILCFILSLPTNELLTEGYCLLYAGYLTPVPIVETWLFFTFKSVGLWSEKVTSQRLSLMSSNAESAICRNIPKLVFSPYRCEPFLTCHRNP